MKLGFFRKSPYEGLVLARSNGAGEVDRRGSTTMIEWNKIARENEAGSSDGSNWSSLKERAFSNHTTSDAGSTSSSVDQGPSSSVGAHGSSSSQSVPSGNDATSPASQGGGVQNGGPPVPIVQSAPANSVSQELPASSAQSQPGPTPAELPQPVSSPPADQPPASAPAQASSPAATTSSSQAEIASPVPNPSSSPTQAVPPAANSSSPPVDISSPVAAPTSTPEISPPSAAQSLPLTSSLPVAIQTTSDLAVSGSTTSELPPPAFPTSSASISTPDLSPPAAAATSLPVDSISSSALITTSAEIVSPPAAAITSLTDLATTPTIPDSTSTTDLAAVQAPTTDSVATQTTISSNPNDVAQTATTDSILTTPVAAALPPVAVQSTVGKDTATSAADAKVSTTSAPSPPPPPGVTSLPPALAPSTNSGARTSLPSAAAPFTNKNTGSSTPATAVNAHLPQTSTNIVHGTQSGTSSSASTTGAALSLQQNRPSGFLTSITPIQVADSLPSTSNNGISSNQGSGSGSKGNTGPGGTGGNDVNGPNGNGISASIQDHSTMSKTTQAVGFTFITIGSIALVVGIIFLIRRVLRQRRLGKAYSPPSSPLLNAIGDPLPSGIQRSMSERSAMGTGKSEFWSTSDSNTMIGPVGTTTYPPYRPDTAAMYVTDNGMYRSELNGNGRGGVGAFGGRTELNGAGNMSELDGQPKEWSLDSNRNWDENMDISPLSTTSGGLIGAEMGRAASVRVDGMRFEMVGETKRFEMPGDTEFKPNEKPLGRRGGSSGDPPNV